MIRSKTMLAAVALATLALGCGGSNPGGGTRTLFVRVVAESDGSTDGTSLALQVREGGSNGPIVSDAAVLVRGDKTGEATVPWQGVRWGDFAAGAYVRDGIAWDSGWAIQVRRGSDFLDAYLANPGITTITEPIGGTTFRRADGKPLAIRWKDDYGRRSEQVRVRLDKAQIDQVYSDDKGSLELELNRLVATDKERIEVIRTNDIELAGGTPGSSFQATTRHRIEFRVE